ncbi:MAG: hypothetical protein R6V59_06275 [Dehalococcoidia bacterium]
MLGRIRKGESVVGMRAVTIRGKSFHKGPVLVRGSYAGKMRDWHMVQTGRGKIYLCSDVRKAD